MRDLISRQALCDFALNQRDKTITPNDIMRFPAADPVEHGKWIGTQWDGYADGNPVYDEWECSVCGYVFAGNEAIWRYCPNCGAKMDGEKE